MTDSKRPGKGTLRLAPRADKPADGAPKTPSVKSGARRVAAAVARGERLRPAPPAKAGAPRDGAKAPGRPWDPGRAKGPRTQAGPTGPRDQRAERPRGSAWSAEGNRERPARRDEAVRPARPERPARPIGDGPAGRGKAAAGGAGDPWASARRDRVREPREAHESHDESRRAAPSAGDPTDVWAQARANLAARASKPTSKPAAERRSKPAAPRRPQAEPAAPPAAPAGARPTPDHPLYDPQGVRVSKLLATQGLCSRREADSYIERGWVLVNGQRVTELGLRVAPDAEVSLAPEAHAMQTKQVTILLHKPVGYVSGQPELGYEPAASLIGPANQIRGAAEAVFHPGMLRGLAPAGRLDIDSTGLLVLTQDGRIARQLVGDDTTVDKEYIVRVEGTLVDNGLALLNHGLSLDDQPLRPARVEWINDDQLRFVLREGRKRQIRRMCELVGLQVVGLKRVRIGQVRLGDLPIGCWRLLREGESF